MVRVYKQRGFSISLGLADGEFDTPGIHESLAGEGVALDPMGRDKHMGDVERYVCTVKERMRATYNTLPFTHMPTRLVIEMAKQAMFWLHSAFPRADGVSDHMSPREIMTGQKLDYARHCRFEFGEYVKTHEEHDSSMTPRTIGALALRPTGNAQGTWYFTSLSTGRVLKRNHVTKLPMPHEVIDSMHHMARRQKANPGLVFGNRSNVLDPMDDSSDSSDFDDDSDDASYADEDRDSDDDNWSQPSCIDETDSDNDEPHDDGADPSIDDDLDNQGDDEVDDDLDAGADDDSDAAPAPEETRVHDDHDTNLTSIVEEPGVGGEDITNTSVMSGNGVDQDTEPAEDQGVDDATEQDDDTTGADADSMDVRYGQHTSRYNLRQRTEPSFAHLKTFSDAHANAGMSQEDGESLATAQMSMKKGLKMFGEAGGKAVQSEMRQLHECNVMKPVHARELTPDERREALAYLMFLKQKWCGKVKGCGCANGRKLR
jgi:hypothetical protein